MYWSVQYIYTYNIYTYIYYMYCSVQYIYTYNIYIYIYIYIICTVACYLLHHRRPPAAAWRTTRRGSFKLTSEDRKRNPEQCLAPGTPGSSQRRHYGSDDLLWWGGGGQVGLSPPHCTCEMASQVYLSRLHPGKSPSEGLVGSALLFEALCFMCTNTHKQPEETATEARRDHLTCFHSDGWKGPKITQTTQTTQITSHWSWFVKSLKWWRVRSVCKTTNTQR